MYVLLASAGVAAHNALRVTYENLNAPFASVLVVDSALHVFSGCDGFPR